MVSLFAETPADLITFCVEVFTPARTVRYFGREENLCPFLPALPMANINEAEFCISRHEMLRVVKTRRSHGPK